MKTEYHGLEELEGKGTENSLEARPGWLKSFFRELVTMPRRHVVVFILATVLLVLLEVELTEGWHLVHLLELGGVVLLVLLLWTAWRTRSRLRSESR